MAPRTAVLAAAVLSLVHAGHAQHGRRRQQQQQQQRRHAEEEEKVETVEEAAQRLKKEVREDEDYFEDLYQTKGSEVSETRDERIFALQEEHREINSKEVHPARVEFELARARLRAASTGSSWFWSAEQKTLVAGLEKEAQAAGAKLQQAEARAVAVYAQIKPLYGVLSVQHWKEQRRQVSQSLGIATDVAHSNMIWGTLFNAGRAENLQDLLMQMVLNYLTGLVTGYVYAFIHFFFSAPWIIYEYCSGWGDLPAALIMWLAGMTMFLLPAILMLYGCAFMAARSERRRGQFQRQQYAGIAHH